MSYDSSYDLYFDEAITSWDEALPLGNGMMGCLVWGNGVPLRFSLDRGDLWDIRPTDEILAKDYTYEELIRLVENKDQESILKRFDRFYWKPTPTKIPAGKLELEYRYECKNIQSRLDMSKAVAEVKLDFGETFAVIKTFLHATDRFGAISITGNAEIPSISLKCHDYGNMENEQKKDDKSKSGVQFGSLQQLKYPAAQFAKEGLLQWFEQKTLGGVDFAIIVGQKRSGGSQSDIVYLVAASSDGADWLEKGKRKVLDGLEQGFKKALRSHGKWWESFWAKSSITLPEKEFEKQWYLTNYLFGSCSRKGAPPMPLQGVWTADEDSLPPWKGDYHHDLNTQMSYWHYLKANHLEEGESFIDFLWDLMPQARSFAGKFFDAPGICLPSVMSIDGKSLGGWSMYATNLVNQIWLCQAFDHYWKYTGNDEFLKEKAYPYFKETALCILRWLKPGPDGKLLLPLSSSPEIHDNLIEAWLTPNSNNDLALLIYLFKTLKEMADILQNKEHDFWEEKLKLLPELSINEKNVLMLSPDESLMESHRHLAHTMAVYPLNLLDYHSSDRNREIIDATVANLELLGKGKWIGFGFTWMAELYARQCNGEGAAYHLKLFWDNFCSKNGFNLNGDYKKRGVSTYHYRPFTLETNMCAADVLQEMLLQTYGGVIRVFPAIPCDWRKKEVRFEDFRGEKGVLLSAALAKGKLEYILLKAERKADFKIENSFEAEELTVAKDTGLYKIACKKGEIFEVSLGQNEKCRITCR